MDLRRLSLVDLKDLNRQVTDEINKRSREEIDKARQRIREIAEGVGLPLSDLVSKSKARQEKTKPAIKYRNPRNSAQQWSGRGRKPQWLVELERVGQLDTARI